MVTDEYKRHVLRKKAREGAVARFGAGLGPNLQRSTMREGSRESKKNFLIACEGGASEPNYFDWLRDKWRVNAEIEYIRGAGAPTGIVKAAIKAKAAAVKSDTPYDQVWAVFDKDEFTDKDVNTACTLAGQNDIEVAFSNECFELWYLLHFDYLDAALGRELLYEKLERRLPFSYDKAETKIHPFIHPKLPDAVRNAKKLWERNGATKENPCTGIHLLVKEFAANAAPSRDICAETEPVLQLMAS